MNNLKFKIGDTVKIVKRSEYYIKWNSMGLMANTIGTIGKILLIYENHAYINFGIRDWSYDFECLKLVKVKQPKWKNAWKDQ